MVYTFYLFITCFVTIVNCSLTNNPLLPTEERMVICVIELLGYKHTWWLAQGLAYSSALYMFIIVFNKYGQLKTKVSDVNKI